MSPTWGPPAAINDIFDGIFTDFVMNGAVTSVDAQQQIDLGSALQWVDFDTIQSVGDKSVATGSVFWIISDDWPDAFSL